VLDGVGPGSLLGGRYALRHQLSDADTEASWQAHDRTLDRTVVVRVVPESHPHADAMLDAARRAAGVEDPRLVRVLDVGRESSLVWVVTELIAGATLGDRLRDGPMPAPDVRTIVGEASLALEHARQRGLHHLVLTPDDVHQLDDDSVRLGGLSVSAALAGVEVPDAAQASARDTEGLVALAYAGLTGYWPLPSPTALPPAPQVSGAPAAPSEIVGGVPADLDTLCAQTFAGAGAPATPGALAAQIAPWGQARPTTRTTGAFPIALAPSRARVSPDGASTPGPARTQPVQTQPVQTQPVQTQPVQTPPTPARPLPRPDLRPAAKAIARVAATTATRAKAGAARREATDPAGFGTGFGAGLFDEGQDTDEGHDADQRHDAPAPPVRAATANRPPQTQTRTVLVLVAGLVAVFLLLGYCGLRSLGDNAFLPHPSRTPSARPTPAPTATRTPPPTRTPTVAPTPIAVTSVTGFDPQGDGSEKNSIAARVLDGDPGTAWTSDTYRSRGFGGLKDGVGLLLDLGAPTAVRSVKVSVVGSGSTLQLRTATGDTLTGSAVVAQAVDASGTLTLTPSAAVTSRYLALWFPVPAPSNGGYRVGVAEVTVS